MSKKIAIRSLLFLLTASLPTGLIGAQEKAPEPEPYQVDFVEETGIDLILLDVEVYDQDGRPMRGLALPDFTLKINGKVRTLYSVDDLCTCDDPDSNKPLIVEESQAPQLPASTSPPIPPEPMLYILYLNFGQLDQDGRINALAEAERWVREVLQPGEQVQIMAWTSVKGLRQLTDVTDSRETLLAALANAAADPTLLDPFPTERSIRQKECAACYDRCIGLDSIAMQGCIKFCQVTCRDFARNEYAHGSWSMDALQRLLYRLEQVRGRKTVLYFYQNDALYPARLFAGLDANDVRDLNDEMEQVGADAVLSRTTIAAAYTGSDPNGAGINVGANLADLSGGSYNRALNLLPAITTEAGRGCRCIYRIGVEPPPLRRNDLYHAAVFVQDRRIPRGLRLQHLTRFDRWLREAQAVLRSPEDITDVLLTSSLHPMRLRKGRWQVAVRVAMDAEGLLLLPAAGGKSGAWETGALLHRDPGVDAVELLAHSRLTVENKAIAGSYIVHERVLDGLKPGEWYLGAFIRDRNARTFGGGKVEITLPKPGEAGISTPVPFLSGQPWIRTGLPDLTDQPKQVAGATRSTETLRASLPLPKRPVRRGDGLTFKTWVCSPKQGKVADVVRFVARDGEPIFRFETVKPPRGGSCAEVVDPVDTRYLTPGEYVYHVRYAPEIAPEPLAAEQVFVLE